MMRRKPLRRIDNPTLHGPTECPSDLARSEVAAQIGVLRCVAVRGTPVESCLGAKPAPPQAGGARARGSPASTHRTIERPLQHESRVHPSSASARRHTKGLGLPPRPFAGSAQHGAVRCCAGRAQARGAGERIGGGG